MPDRVEDLEIFRERFISELAEAQPDLSSYQDFLRYWKGVEQQAQHTEDLGQLDGWVRDLARDKEKVQGLKNRADMIGDKEGAQGLLLSILRMVLEVLESVERRLRRWRDERLSILASMLWKGGPGGAAKPKPDDKDKKDGKKGEESAKDVAAGAQAQKQDPALKKDKDKKFER
jgi:hypothetical protein